VNNFYRRKKSALATGVVIAEKYDAAANQTIVSRASTRELGFHLRRIPFEVRQRDAATFLNEPQLNNSSKNY
jgi:hypothetical protein